MRQTLFGILVLALACPVFAQQKNPAPRPNVSSGLASRFKWLGNCDDSGGGLCADLYTHKNYEGQYTGHDEPAIAFYSATPNSGNSMVVRLKIPTEPPTPPNQNGTGGTFNFQLHPAFWFSMILCDTQSAPEFTTTCVPDSDANIFDNPDPAASDYINLHPGGAFMELQFYPPGWVFIPTEPTQHWVAALNIASFNSDQTGLSNSFLNNADCLNTVGEEPLNFAFVTRTGVPQAPPDPFNVVFDPFGTQLADPAQALLMNPGDDIIIFMHDHPEGFRVIIFDETTKAFGWMTASAANGFAQIQFQPDPDPSNPSVTCTELPYAFHPMYSTSSEHTRLTWTAHAFNVGFSDELGHFEYCGAVDENFNCIAPGSSEPDGMLDFDDIACASTLPPPSPFPFVAVAGCIFEDLDFDGVSYGANWPGSLADPAMDSLLHATPIRFSSPRFNAENGLADYDRVAFESISPGNEFDCDEIAGSGCVDPPPGASFFPLYTTGVLNGGCVWQFGGASIPATTNVFGGTAAAEFGPLTSLDYPVGLGFSGFPLFGVFRQVLNTNPCPANPAGF